MSVPKNEIWIATGNQGKLNEFKMLLNRIVSMGCNVHSQGELPVFSSPPENGDTFVANARIKARALKSVKSGVWVIADDSGICVEGLGGVPGIHSARYAGPHARDSENNAKLLKMLTIRHVANRNATFVCAVVAFDPLGNEHVFEGKLSGQVAKAASTGTGFGYDPIFIPDGETQTLAQIGTARKNQISHRAKALAELIPQIEKSML